MANLSNINGKFVVEQTTGFVGIGTTDPDYLLHVNSSDIPNGTRLIIQNTNGSGKKYGLISDNTGVFTVRDVTAGADRFSISNLGDATFAGNVNIGPDALDIQLKAASNNSGKNLIYLRGNASGDKAEISLNHFGYANMFIGMGTTANTVMSLTATSGGTDGIIIDSSGNVGIGITPNVNSSVVNVIQLGKGMTLMGNANDDRATMAANLYLDTGTAFRYVMDGLAGRFSIEDGNMVWGTASSGTAGTVATVDTKMTLLNNGNLGINQTNPQALLSLGAGIDAQKLLLYDDNNNFKYGFGIQSAEFRQFFPNSATARMVFGTIDDSDGSTFSEKMRIDSDGNVGIGANSPAEKLHVSGGNIRLDSTVAGGNGILMIYDSSGTQSGQIYGSSGDLKIYSPADVLFNQGGNVGINANDPVKTLDVRGSLAISNSTASYWYMDRNDTTGNFDLNENINGTLFTVDTNGKVGIGTISPVAPLQIERASNTTLALSNSGSVTSGTRGEIAVYNSSISTCAAIKAVADTDNVGTGLEFYTRPVGGALTDSMRITSGGRVTIKNKPNSGLGYDVLISLGTGADGDVGYQTLSQLNTNLAGASDIRFKKNIEIIPNAIEKIKTINGYTFDWDSENEDYNYLEKEGRDAGVIAQEIQKVLPEIVQIATVDRDEEGKSTSGKNYLSVDYKKIIPLLIQGIKEQESSIQELKAEIEILKNK